MRKRKGLAVIAAIVMTAVMSLGSSLAATSVGISDGAAAVEVNGTIVGFAGHEWWVIGDAKGGVYPQRNSVTLLAKEHNDDFGKVEFRKGAKTQEDSSWTEYDGNGYWYEGEFEEPSNYKGSTLQKKMESITSGLPKKEAGRINSRTLTADDDENNKITGGNVKDQNLWAISVDEWSKIKSTPAKAYDSWFSLRSPNGDFTARVGNPNGGNTSVNVRNSYATRPALNLNMSSVIFTSDAGQTGKAAATPGGGLVSVTAPDTTGTNNKIKYTFKDDENLKLGNVYVSKVEGNSVTVAYNGATGGKTLSFIVKDSKGVTTHYGKLAEKINAEGQAILDITNIDLSTNTIEVFAEEINGADESDFASTPKALDMTVKNMVAVSGGSGGGLHAKDSEVTITANVPEGKYLSKWEISPEVKLAEGSSLTDVTIKFNMPGEKVTATAVYGDLIVYPTKDSGNTSWTQGSEGGLTITSEGEHRKFTGVTVDGNTVDSQYYTVESGSTIITLKASYLSTLSVGEHVLRIHFTDGYTETKFSIQAAQTDKPAPPTTDPVEPTPPVNPGEPTSPVNPPVQPGEPNPPVQGGTTTATTVATAGTSPKTGDSNMIWIMTFLMLGAGVGFMVINVMKKSKRRN